MITGESASPQLQTHPKEKLSKVVIVSMYYILYYIATYVCASNVASMYACTE